jgi:hypothetical protein
METRIWTGNVGHSQAINQGHQNFSSMLPSLRNTGEINQTANLLLLDNSLSTKEPASADDGESKLFREREVATYFVSRLPANTFFGMVTFGNPAVLVIPLQALSEKLTAIRAIQACDYAEGTGLKSSLKIAIKEFNKVSAGYVKRLYCATDGVPTDGDCTDEANVLKSSGIQLHFIGFGDTSTSDIDEDYMRSLASNSQTEGILYKHFTCANQFTKFMGRQTQMITR